MGIWSVWRPRRACSRSLTACKTATNTFRIYVEHWISKGKGFYIWAGTLHLATMLGIKNRSKPFVIKKDINKNKHDYVTLDPKLVGKEIDRRLSEIEHSLMSMLKTLPKDNALKDYVDDPNYTPKLRERKSRSGGSNSSQGGLRYEIRVPSRQSLLNAEEEGLQAALEEIAIYDEDEMKVHEKVRGELKSREKEAIKLIVTYQAHRPNA